MNGENRHVVPSLNGDADLPERLWAYDDFAIDEDEPATDYAAGLTNLRFIRSAVRRSARLWLGTAVAGLLCALAMLAAAPPRTRPRPRSSSRITPPTTRSTQYRPIWLSPRATPWLSVR